MTRKLSPGSVGAVGYLTENADLTLQRYGFGGWPCKSDIAVRRAATSSASRIEKKSVAFSDPLSTSGFLYPVAAVKEAGIDIGNEDV